MPTPAHGPEPDDAALLEVLSAAAAAVEVALRSTPDWGLADTRPGQYLSDLAADAAAVDVLTRAGLGVLSEESGRHHPDRPLTVVVDPLDGSTNASRRLSWFATSLCVVDEQGPRVSLVVDLVSGTRYDAVRGGGARRDGEPIHASAVTALDRAIIGLNGMPSQHFGWNQFRALGAAALDLCAVADGRLDGFVDCTDDGLAPWDYLGAALVCTEAGARIADLHGRALVDMAGARRTVVAAATPELAASLATARAATTPAVPPAR